MACQIGENIVIHPFAFQVHTHELGVIVSAYRVRRNGSTTEWQLIGKGDPSVTQIYYNIEKENLMLNIQYTLLQLPTFTKSHRGTEHKYTNRRNITKSSKGSLL